jgi:hypothetical protein
MYQSLQGSQCQITIIGDDLSLELLDFFKAFENVAVDNDKLGSAANSLQKQIDIALKIPDNEKKPKGSGLYFCTLPLIVFTLPSAR